MGTYCTIKNIYTLTIAFGAPDCKLLLHLAVYDSHCYLEKLLISLFKNLLEVAGSEYHNYAFDLSLIALVTPYRSAVYKSVPDECQCDLALAFVLAETVIIYVYNLMHCYVSVLASAYSDVKGSCCLCSKLTLNISHFIRQAVDVWR